MANFENFFADLFGGTPQAPQKQCEIHHYEKTCRAGLVYVARSKSKLIKIGWVVREPSKAMKRISLQYRMNFTFLFALETHCALGLETHLHKLFQEYHKPHRRGTELFCLPESAMHQLSNISEYYGKPVKRIDAIDFLDAVKGRETQPKNNLKTT